MYQDQDIIKYLNIIKYHQVRCDESSQPVLTPGWEATGARDRSRLLKRNPKKIFKTKLKIVKLKPNPIQASPYLSTTCSTKYWRSTSGRRLFTKSTPNPNHTSGSRIQVRVRPKYHFLWALLRLLFSSNLCLQYKYRHHHHRHILGKSILEYLIPWTLLSRLSQCDMLVLVVTIWIWAEIWNLGFCEDLMVGSAAGRSDHRIQFTLRSHLNFSKTSLDIQNLQTHCQLKLKLEMGTDDDHLEDASGMVVCKAARWRWLHHYWTSQSLTNLIK